MLMIGDTMNKVRDLVWYIAGHDDNIDRLEAVKDLLIEDHGRILQEIEMRIRFINRCNEKGDPNCKYCHGYGFGADGRGDPWTCTDCKPDLKTFWDDL